MSAGTQTKPAAQSQYRAQPVMTTEEKDAQLLQQIIDDAERVQAIADRVSPEKMQHVGMLKKAFMIADAIKKLRESVTPRMMDSIMALMGTSLGFVTDRDRPPKKGGPWERYDVDTVKDCWIAATLKGARTSGNEFNIIAGREYLTQTFYLRACKEVEGVTDFDVIPGTPIVREGKTLVRMGVTWKKNGVADFLKDQEGKSGRVFVVKGGEYAADDQIIGKAIRKAAKAAYEYMTGVTMQDADDLPDTVPERPRKLDDLTAKLNGKKDDLPDDRRRVEPVSESGSVNHESDSMGESVDPDEIAILDKIDELHRQLGMSEAQAKSRQQAQLAKIGLNAGEQPTVEHLRIYATYLEGQLERG